MSYELTVRLGTLPSYVSHWDIKYIKNVARNRSLRKEISYKLDFNF